jgi:hypothetical protein
VEASVRNAATLLEDGYRLIPSLSAPLTYLVFKPKQDVTTDTPAYQVELVHDPEEGDPCRRSTWSYRCSCELFRQQERRGTDEPSRCKHGERALVEWLRRFNDVAVLLGYTPEIPQTVRTGNRFGTAALSRNEPPAPGAHEDLPWPTQRAYRLPNREEDFG